MLQLIGRRRVANGSVAGFSAFLSYSRAMDQMFAPALQTALQRFGKAWYQRHRLRVFRDDANLSANPGLWTSIEAVLDSCEFFVLLASTAAARSGWVEREVAYWLAHRSPDTLLIALTDGEIAVTADGDIDPAETTALPSPLNAAARAVPRYTDFRWMREEVHLDERDPRFRECVADLAATLNRQSKDDLIGEDISQQRRTVRLVRGVVTILALITVAAVVSTVVAIAQRRTALERLDLATSRQVASDARSKVGNDPQLAALLSLAAYQVRDTPEARGAMFAALQGLPGVDGILAAGSSAVNAVAVSPDGRVLATGDSSGTVRLWDARTRQVIRTLTSGISSVLSLGFSPDGTMLAAGGNGLHGEYQAGRVAIWNAADGYSVSDEFDGQWTGVRALAFSPDSATLAFAGGHKTAPEDRDNPFGMAVVLLGVGADAGRQMFRGHTNSVLGLVFSPEGRTLYSTSWFETIAWDTESASPRFELPGATAIALSPGGERLALANSSALTLVDTASGQKVSSSPHDTSEFTTPSALAFSPRDDVLVEGGQTGFSGSSSAVLRLWNLSSMEPSSPLPAHTGPITSITFGSNGQQFVTGSADGSAIVWGASGRSHTSAVFPVGHGPVRGLAISEDGQTVVTSAKDSSDAAHVLVLDATTGAVQNSFPVGSSRWADVEFADNDRVVLGATDNGVIAWDVASGQRRDLYDVSAETIAVGVDGRLLLGQTIGSRLLMSDPGAAGLRAFSAIPTTNFGTPVFSPDGRRFAVQTSGPTINRIVEYDVATEEVLRSFDSPDGLIVDIAYGADGVLLAGVSLRGKVMLFGASSSGAPVVLPGHTATGSAVALSPDGKLLVSGGRKEMILWSVEQRSEIARLPASMSAAGSLRFGPDGASVFGVQDDGTVVRWAISPISWHDVLCRVVGRSLTDDEWREYLPDRDPAPLC